MRTCDACGVEFEPKNARHRFHSDTCRQRGRKAPGKAKAPRRADVSVEVATNRALEAVGKAQTPLGQAALVLARSLDVAGQSGQTLAAMTRELRATLAEVTAGATKADDPVDELARKRRERQAAARR